MGIRAGVKNRHAAQHHRGEEGRRGQGTADLFQQYCQVGEVAAGAAVLLGEGHSGPAEVDHLPPQTVGESPWVFFHLPDQSQGALPGQEILGAGLQHLLYLA